MSKSINGGSGGGRIRFFFFFFLLCFQSRLQPNSGCMLVVDFCDNIACCFNLKA
ncbi:hypothetical protein HanHA300_Chr08g0296911 [Helianthus annuus]|nr:hypothetical protein HanHA300_Chr08g0296911 [Helianthus annuus]KAJ0555061.1 hypothetical protein HanHA89_Chr08g0315411 [Helianthus annuus]